MTIEQLYSSLHELQSHFTKSQEQVKEEKNRQQSLQEELEDCMKEQEILQQEQELAIKETKENDQELKQAEAKIQFCNSDCDSTQKYNHSLLEEISKVQEKKKNEWDRFVQDCEAIKLTVKNKFGWIEKSGEVENMEKEVEKITLTIDEAEEVLQFLEDDILSVNQLKQEEDNLIKKIEGFV